MILFSVFLFSFQFLYYLFNSFQHSLISLIKNSLVHVTWLNSKEQVFMSLCEWQTAVHLIGNPAITCSNLLCLGLLNFLHL